MGETTVTIQFQSEVSVPGQMLVARLDPSETMYNLGKTVFGYGDTVYFQVFTSPGILPILPAGLPLTTDGTITQIGGTETAIIGATEEDKILLQYLTENIATVSIPCDVLLTADPLARWFGNNLGPVTKVADNQLQALSKPDNVIGLYRAVYTAKFRRYSLKLNTIPTLDSWPVVVLIKV